MPYAIECMVLNSVCMYAVRCASAAFAATLTATSLTHHHPLDTTSITTREYCVLLCGTIGSSRHGELLSGFLNVQSLNELTYEKYTRSTLSNSETDPDERRDVPPLPSREGPDQMTVRD